MKSPERRGHALLASLPRLHSQLMNQKYRAYSSNMVLFAVWIYCLTISLHRDVTKQRLYLHWRDICVPLKESSTEKRSDEDANNDIAYTG
jgi:hypothetical protein